MELVGLNFYAVLRRLSGVFMAFALVSFHVLSFLNCPTSQAVNANFAFKPVMASVAYAEPSEATSVKHSGHGCVLDRFGGRSETQSLVPEQSLMRFEKLSRFAAHLFQFVPFSFLKPLSISLDAYQAFLRNIISVLGRLSVIENIRSIVIIA